MFDYILGILVLSLIIKNFFSQDVKSNCYKYHSYLQSIFKTIPKEYGAHYLIPMCHLWLRHIGYSTSDIKHFQTQSTYIAIGVSFENGVGSVLIEINKKSIDIIPCWWMNTGCHYYWLVLLKQKLKKEASIYLLHKINHYNKLKLTTSTLTQISESLFEEKK